MPPKTSGKATQKSATGKRTAANGERRKRKPKRKESYSVYIYRVLKSLHQPLGISSKAMAIMNSFMNDIFERLASEAAALSKKNKKQTISIRDMQSAVKLVLPSDLAKFSVSEGSKAVAKFNASNPKKRKPSA